MSQCGRQIMLGVRDQLLLLVTYLLIELKGPGQVALRNLALLLQPIRSPGGS